MDLVSGKGKHINAEGGKIDVDITDSLYSIGEHKRTLFMGDLCYLLDRLDGSDLVVSIHYRNDRGTLGNRITKGIER